MRQFYLVNIVGVVTVVVLALLSVSSSITNTVSAQDAGYDNNDYGGDYGDYQDYGQEEQDDLYYEYAEKKYVSKFTIWNHLSPFSWTANNFVTLIWFDAFLTETIELITFVYLSFH